MKRGEIGIAREYRQKCPVHGGPWVSPLVNRVDGAKWMMFKMLRYVWGKFYRENDIGPVHLREENRRSSTGEMMDNTKTSFDAKRRYSADGVRPENLNQMNQEDFNGRSLQATKVPLYKPKADHEKENCEACMANTCPLPFMVLWY